MTRVFLFVFFGFHLSCVAHPGFGLFTVRVGFSQEQRGGHGFGSKESVWQGILGYTGGGQASAVPDVQDQAQIQ